MKIIEAMKKIKDNNRKMGDLRKKIKNHAADIGVGNPVYGSVEEQSKMVRGWLQSHEDLSRETARLRLAIQRTNVTEVVSIGIGDRVVTKTISEWVSRRRYLADADAAAWSALHETELSGEVPSGRLVRRYYDPAEKDAKLEEYQAEPSLIDGHLEVVNATTDLVEV